ncbi:MAG: response regulator transcription factor [Alphaproteobacteria bacterium]|nr:response regulator transcription factor [Alphaproteobacteria bacterium]
MHRLLLVEDEPDLLEPTRAALNALGCEVRVATTGSEALIAAAEDPPPDMVLLDLMLPDQTGIAVCHKLRDDPRTSHVPIIIVSARTDEYDRVIGFEAGADDYITKPYSLRELTLRVQALLRRAPVTAATTEADHDESLVLDPVAHRATLFGEELGLTVVEFRMLSTFVANRGKALTREQLCLATWGQQYAISVRAVDTNIKRLRQKLGTAGRSLETIRGVGYRWTGGTTT